MARWRSAQTLGISLAEILDVLDRLPHGAVKAADWAAAAEPWAEALDDRIELLLRLRDTLGHCIGCGCLSLTSCPLYNPDDAMAAHGPGARRWLGGEEERADAPVP